MSVRNVVVERADGVRDTAADVYGRDKGIKGVTSVRGRKVGKQVIDENSSVKNIESKVKDMIAGARTLGYWVAADNLEHYINGRGGVRYISRRWLRSYTRVKEAEKFNFRRFQSDILAKAKKGGGSFSSFWDRVITYNNAGFNVEQLFFASGDSTLRSNGSFIIKVIGNKINVKGLVMHKWYDNYDWHVGWQAEIPGFGSIPDAAMRKLQTHGKAREFRMECKWKHRLEAEFLLGDSQIRWNLFFPT